MLCTSGPRGASSDELAPAMPQGAGDRLDQAFRFATAPSAFFTSSSPTDDAHLSKTARVAAWNAAFSPSDSSATSTFRRLSSSKDDRSLPTTPLRLDAVCSLAACSADARTISRSAGAKLSQIALLTRQILASAT